MKILFEWGSNAFILIYYQGNSWIIMENCISFTSWSITLNVFLRRNDDWGDCVMSNCVTETIIRQIQMNMPQSGILLWFRARQTNPFIWSIVEEVFLIEQYTRA